MGKWDVVVVVPEGGCAGDILMVDFPSDYAERSHRESCREEPDANGSEIQLRRVQTEPKEDSSTRSRQLSIHSLRRSQSWGRGPWKQNGEAPEDELRSRGSSWWHLGPWKGKGKETATKADAAGEHVVRRNNSWGRSSSFHRGRPPVLAVPAVLNDSTDDEQAVVPSTTIVPKLSLGTSSAARRALAHDGTAWGVTATTQGRQLVQIMVDILMPEEFLDGTQRAASNDNWLVAVPQESKAYGAGLRTGDEIVELNGEQMSGRSIVDALERLPAYTTLLLLAVRTSKGGAKGA